MRSNLPMTVDGSLDVDSLLALHRATFGSTRMDGEGEGGNGDAGAGSGGAGGGAETVYTPPATQADFDKIVQDRVRRATQAGYADAEAKFKPGHDKHEALEVELGSAADKAAKAARDEENAKLTAEYTPRVVRAEFKAAAKGVLTDDQLTALLEDLDLSKYVTAKGDVDEDKVTKKVEAFAPAATTTTSTRTVNLGQGTHQQATPKPGDRGRAAAEKRFGDKAKSAVAARS